MAYQPISGSIISYQSPGSIISASVFGTVNTQQVGTRIVSVISSTPSSMLVGASVFGNVGISGTPTFLQLAGSILATSATVTPAANQSVSGTVQTEQIGTRITSLVSTIPSSVIVGASIFGHAPVVIVGGSVATSTTNSSVMLLNGANVIGSVAALQGTNPWIITGSVQATVNTGNSSVQVLNFPANQSVSGTVDAQQIGTRITSVISSTPSSMLVGASVFGNVGISGTPNVNAAGSVVAFQGTSPWVTNFQNSSIISVPVGSVISYLQVPSIVGTYAEDAAHTTADKGVFTLGVRNDALSSITSADLDYSPHAVGPTGETIVAIAPFTKGIQGTGDLRVVQGASVTVIAAQGASIYSYIRAAQLANMGSASVLVTFAGGLGSVLSYSIAPAGGGSNIKFDPWLKTGANSAFTASISGVASVLVSAQGFIAKE